MIGGDRLVYFDDCEWDVRRLWRAYIGQKFEDATCKVYCTRDSLKKADAQRWLLHDTRDFHHICFDADLVPAYVRRHAVKRAKDGWKPINRKNKI